MAISLAKFNLKEKNEILKETSMCYRNTSS